MCNTTFLTLYCFSEIVSLPLPLNDTLVDLAGRDVIIPMQCDVQESLIVSKVKVHLTTII